MTDEEKKRSCYDCELYGQCGLMADVYTAIRCHRQKLIDAVLRRADIFDTLAEICNQYTKMKGAETK